jgi:hypothetical protein
MKDLVNALTRPTPALFGRNSLAVQSIGDLPIGHAVEQFSKRLEKHLSEYVIFGDYFG